MEPNVIRFLLDFCAFLIIVIPSLYFRFFGSNVTFRRGFFCNDESLRYPKKEETYTGKVVWAIAMIVPNLTILFNEIWLYYKRKQLTNRKLVKIFIMDVYKKMLVFTFGLMSVNLVCEYCSEDFEDEILINCFQIGNTFKYGIGRLRPHFFDSCKPVDPITGVSLSNCSNLQNEYEYIENYICSGQTEANLRLSFFSGHATLLSYQFIYFLLYTQNNMQLRYFGIFRPLFQTCHLILSCHLIISRVFDYYHHPSDLVFGSVVGTSGAILAYYYLSEYTESYWVKSSQFLYNYDDEQFVESVEQVDADPESLVIRKRPLGKDVVDKKKLKKTSNITDEEKTPLLSGSRSD